LKDAEFLSGFSKTDKIIPVISLVVYFGSDKWDGPRSLKEMFPEDIAQEILDEVEDYRLHLIIPSEIEDFSMFKTDFGKAMKYIAVSEDKNTLMKLTEEESYRTVKGETARLINECIGSEIVVLEEEEDKNMSMCKGLRDWSEEERQIGREEGIKEGMDELLNSQVRKKLRKNLSLEKIAEDLEEDIEVIRPIYERAKEQI